MAILSVVRFDGLKSRDWLIYKYPSASIVLGSQLIVQEGQCVIFVKGGTVCDVFIPGTYTLSTVNLPILNKLVKLPFGNETPFSAEIYFINTTTKLDLHWGTTDPIQLVDPKYHIKLRIRAFGQMGLKLQDYTAFFMELIGGMNQDDLVRFDKIKEFYRGLLVIKVKTAIADAIITNGISALEIAPKLEELSERVKERIMVEFETYGFRIANFYIQSINFPDGDFEKINQILEDKAAFEIMGDNRYSMMRSFDVYEGVANNANGVAGAFAAGGLGLGVAANMGDSMKQIVGNPMEKEKVRECPGCHNWVGVSAKFCSQCGYSFMKKTCSCGNTLEADAKFCSVCGKRVET